MTNTRIVVITGTSRGLGLTLAKEFASHDWHVIGIGRSPRPHDFPEQAEYHQFDASDANRCKASWQTIYAANPDAKFCLINNAGGYVSGSVTNLKPEDYMQQMQSSYFASVFMTQELVTIISNARIINIISSSALGICPGDSAYGSAKTATMHFFQVLQQEYRPNQYKITNIYPNNIASHGDNASGIAPGELSIFIREIAQSNTSYYMRDVTVYPTAI